jgi:hypothetical protein
MSKLKTRFTVDGSGRTSLVMAPQNATVAEFLQLVQSRLKRSDLAHVWLDGCELLGEESFEDYWAADFIFVLTTGNAPPDAQHLLVPKSGTAAPQPAPAPPQLAAPAPPQPTTLPLVPTQPATPASPQRQVAARYAPPPTRL